MNEIINLETHIMKKEIKKLEEVALAFRRAIESCDVNQFPELLRPVFEEFPWGSCRESSLLLGTYLKRNDYGVFNIVSGEWFGDSSGFKKYKSHAWLEKDGLIVDITANQYPDVNINDEAIVTTDRAWHDLLKWEVEHIADIDIYPDDHLKKPMEDAYQLITDHL